MENSLAQLHEDHRQLQAQLADVEERYQAKKAEHAKRCEELLDEWRKANAELLEERDTITEAAGETEKTLRAAILKAYADNPTTKTVAPGLSVRVTPKLSYDKEKALAWALHHKLALALDAKAFEAIAKTQKLDFVIVNESLTAVIGK